MSKGLKVQKVHGSVLSCILFYFTFSNEVEKCCNCACNLPLIMAAVSVSGPFFIKSLLLQLSADVSTVC